MKNIFICLLLLTLFTGCNQEFLEIKSDKKFVVPKTLKDIEAMLDNNEVMIQSGPYYGELSSDDHFLLSSTWNSLTNLVDKNAYVWSEDFYNGVGVQLDWNNSYSKVFYANNALEILAKLENKENEKKAKILKGTALFHRGNGFFELAQLFCAPYKNGLENTGLGIPLKLESDINLHVKRATIERSYQQILNDLIEAERLLPEYTGIKGRPSKSAASALLSRVYMSMQMYDKALIEVEKVLKDSRYSLMDFNLLNDKNDYPITPFNKEVIFHSTMQLSAALIPQRALVDTTLYESYSNIDLRKTLFFNINAGKIAYKGSYDGSMYMFNGLAIDECYLTKAECLARLNREEEAVQTLNSFLQYRIKMNEFGEIKHTLPKKELLNVILKERRKELLYRGIRWIDLRRLNLDPLTSTTLYRKVNGVDYILEPSSNKYVLPIPPGEIVITNIEQN